jgi:alpha-methylacyl-CoA racemase
MSRLNGFLRGVKVLDLSQYIPGPMASLLLADMGADVLKIEPPHGDEMRNLGPKDGGGAPLFYQALNAGKSVRRMNLKDESDREQFLELVRSADILIEGFRPGVTQRLGVDYATLSQINPGLVYGSISGYGARESGTPRAAHDANFLAESGILFRNGGDQPVYFDPPVSDTSGALFAVIAILGALRERDRSGRGLHLDLALADVMAPLQLMQIADYGANGHAPKPRSTYLNGGAAYYQVYETRDGRHVVLGGVEPKFWRAFCETADRTEWIARQSEPIPQTNLIESVAGFFRELNLSEFLARFADTDCCLSAVLDLGEALETPHARDRDLIRRGAAGELQALFPVYVDGAPPFARRALRQEALNKGMGQ